MKKLIIYLFTLGALFTACENQEWDFPDYDYSTVYFAYQRPVRTLVLGTDYVFDNTLDNEHKCRIMATMGGVYTNDNDVIIDVEVDNSLCDNLIFDSDLAHSVLPMPAEYYSLSSDMQIVIPAGDLMGGIEVQLTDAFFEDTLSTQNNYVIPLVMTDVTNADSILSGSAAVEMPDRRILADWVSGEAPKNYILYAVKFMNPWHASYLRRGVEVVDGSTTITYHETYVEQDEVCTTQTLSNDAVSLALEATNADETTTPFELILTFDAGNNCSVSNPASATYTVSGSGSYMEDADMWGGEARDALYLQYEVDLSGSVHTFTDTLVLRDRGVGFETFNATVIE